MFHRHVETLLTLTLLKHTFAEVFVCKLTIANLHYQYEYVQTSCVTFRCATQFYQPEQLPHPLYPLPVAKAAHISGR